MGRILLLLDQKENRRLLAEYLAPTHEILLPESERALESTFDLGIVDGMALDRLWERVSSRKQAERTAFLPFLLITSRPDVGMVTRHLWKTVDEILITPIEKLECLARVQNLLLAREMSLEFNRVLVQNLPLALLLLDRRGQITQWNPGAEHIFGWNRSEVLGRYPPFVPSQREDDFRRWIEDILHGKRLMGIETQYVTKQGGTIEGILYGSPLPDAQGIISHVLILTADITAYKAMENAVRDSEQKYRSLVENINDVLFSLDPEGHFTYISPVLERFFGYSPPEITGHHFSEFLHPEDLPGVTEHFRRTLEGPTDPYEFRSFSRDGTIHYVRISSRPLIQEGKVKGITGLMTDITWQKQMQAQMIEKEKALFAARETDRMKSTLLSMVSHELRTPLTAIKGLVSTLLQPDIQWEPEQQREFLTVIDQSCDKLTRIIGDLLDMSHLERGTLQMDKKRTSISASIRALEPQLRQITSAHRFEIHVPSTLPMIEIDEMRIGQVITNLVSNAAQYSDPGTRIILEAEYIENAVVVSVSDEGIGIPEAHRERIFIPFVRLENGVARRQKGSGLGLAIARGIIEAHDGKLVVESNPGQGSKFSFSLPVTKAPDHSPAAQPSP